MLNKINAYNTFIYKTNYTLNWHLIKPIAESLVNIDNQHYLEVNGITSFKNKIPIHSIPELKSYYDFIQPIYTKVITEWGYPKDREYYIQNGWFSKYEKGGYVDLHEHDESIAVVCLYIKLPKNGGNIEFLDPYYKIKKEYIIDESFLYNEIEVSENDVLIFGGNELHRSKPNLSNEERWTLTINIGIKNNKLI